jgi:hypothetical protein
MPVRVDRMFRLDQKVQENKKDARNWKTADDAKSIIDPVNLTVQSKLRVSPCAPPGFLVLYRCTWLWAAFLLPAALESSAGFQASGREIAGFFLL